MTESSCLLRLGTQTGKISSEKKQRLVGSSDGRTASYYRCWKDTEEHSGGTEEHSGIPRKGGGGQGEVRAVRMYGEPERHIVSVSRKAKGARETVYQANS